MADRTGTDPSRWVSERTGLTLLAVVTVIAAALVIAPYLQYVLLGVVLAYILTPAQRRLEAYVPSLIAALVLVVVAILAIILPVAYVLAIALREALEIVAAVQDGTLGIEAIETRLEEIGYVVDLDEMYGAYQEPIATGLQGLATGAIEFVGGLPGILIGLTVTLFVLFALLRDGPQLVAWIRRVIPVDDDVQRELFAELDQLMWASVVGNVAVAAIQAILLGFGLAVLDVPALVFLTVATFVLTLLPLVGAFGVWVPVAFYLLVIGDSVSAAALVVYGSLISASDTYLRPALIGRTSAFNSAIIVVGIFGGLVVFGAVGLFIGPVVLGGAKITLDLFARERTADLEDGVRDRDPLEAVEPAADPAAETESDAGIATEAPPVPADETETESDDGTDTAGSDSSTDARDVDGEGARTDDSADSDATADSGSPVDSDGDTDPTR